MTATGSDTRGFVDVCGLDELEPGRVTAVKVGRLPAGAVRLDGTVHVFQGGCPHRGGPLNKGNLRGRLTGPAPGEMVLDSTRPVVACPWHNYEFSLETGRALWDPSLCIRIFESSVVDGRVLARATRREPGGAT
jgi:3-phenylpropionate/trans-cinnamate dioxygenase ferredoxin subunit